jgi:hypothetical protein
MFKIRCFESSLIFYQQLSVLINMQITLWNHINHSQFVWLIILVSFYSFVMLYIVIMPLNLSQIWITWLQSSVIKQRHIVAVVRHSYFLKFLKWEHIGQDKSSGIKLSIKQVNHLVERTEDKATYLRRI